MGNGENFGPMYRQDGGNVPANTKEKSKLTKPRAGGFEIRYRNEKFLLC